MMLRSCQNSRALHGPVQRGRLLVVRPVAAAATLMGEDAVKAQHKALKEQAKMERKALKEQAKMKEGSMEKDKEKDKDKEEKRRMKKEKEARMEKEVTKAMDNSMSSDEEKEKEKEEKKKMKKDKEEKMDKGVAKAMDTSMASDEEKEKEKEKEEKKKMKKAKEERMEKEVAKAMGTSMSSDEEEQVKLARKMVKAEAKKLRMEAEARGALYSLHWCVAPKAAAAMPAMVSATPAPQQPGTGVMPGDANEGAMQFISSIKMDLKRCEKVAKDAVWFATKEAPEGATHMVLVTANAKTALKYGLAELPQGVDTHMLSLGQAGDVEVPVATLRAMVMAQREEDSDSDSDEEEGTMGMMPGKAKAAKPAAVGGSAVQLDSQLDEATAAALAFADMADKAEAGGGDLTYPPFRSFL